MKSDFISGFKTILATAFILLTINTIGQDKKKEEWPKYKFGGGPDSTYGKGGKTTIDTAFFKNGSMAITIGYRDKNNNFRQSTQIFIDNDDKTEHTTTEYYDANNNKIKETSVIKDQFGKETYNREEYFKDKKTESGDMYYDVQGVKEKIHKRYNKETEKWEYVDKVNGKSGDEGKEEKKTGDPDVTSFLYLGPSLIIEDSKPNHFSTYGANVAYTKKVANSLGITGEGGANFGSLGEIDITKIQALAGLTFLPAGGNVSVHPHILAGVAFINSKYTNSKSSNSYLAMAGGADVCFNVGNTPVAVRADFNPAFTSGNIKSNFRLGAGLILRNGKPGNREKEKTNLLLMANISARDFESDPGLYKPDDIDFGTADNQSHISTNNCDGSDTFDYYNPSANAVIATLVVKNMGECGVNVLIQKINNRPAKKGDSKPGKEEGSTKEKNKGEGKDKGGKKGKESFTKMFDYYVDKIQGSDVFTFQVPKDTWIRVIVLCTQGGNKCEFKRTFTVTKDKPVVKANKDDVPKMKVDPPTAIRDSITKYTPMGNRCMSKDLVFYKITNRDVKENMNVYFKAVSECGCYFEAYTDTSPEQMKGEPYPLEGGKLGDGGKNESSKIAKPAGKAKPKEGDEQVQLVPPGKTIYIKGRCPVQNPMAGPCVGSVVITGISYTSK